MLNSRMQHSLKTGECIDVRKVGTEVEPGVFELQHFDADKDYCDADSEAWIWSVGLRLSDGKFFAATDTRFYQNPEYRCTWLR